MIQLQDIRGLIVGAHAIARVRQSGAVSEYSQLADHLMTEEEGNAFLLCHETYWFRAHRRDHR